MFRISERLCRACVVSLVAAAALLLSACGDSGYPKDWPKPAHGWLAAKKGDCPDLVGTYTGVRSELSWLLGSNPDYEKPLPSWQEHRASITQGDDGSWLRIEMTLTAAGLQEYRNRMIRYNLQASGIDEPVVVALKAERDYECHGGWLYNIHFPQYEKVHGWQRESLRLGRDDDGGLIAGATIAEDRTIGGWGDSRGIPIGSWSETRWRRWPREDDAAVKAIAAAQSVTLHRYRWTNHDGTTVPIRFTSFYLEPVCARFVEMWSGNEVVYPLDGPEPRTSGGEIRLPCPRGWGKFDVGEVLRRDLEIPTDEHSKKYRIEWFALSTKAQPPNVIAIDDVRSLPVMPR